MEIKERAALLVKTHGVPGALKYLKEIRIKSYKFGKDDNYRDHLTNVTNSVKTYG